MIITHNGTILTNDGVVLNNIITSPSFQNTYSLDFDGADDYVDCGVISHLQNTTQYSISSWFKSPLNNLYQVIYSWDDGSDGYLQLMLANDGTFYVYNSRTSLSYGVTSASIASTDTWYNATVIFDGSGATNSDRLKLYINGSLIPFVSFNGTIPTQTGAMLVETMWLGASTGFNFWGLEGNIDEVSIFNYSLSDAEALTIGGTIPTDLSLLATLPTHWYRNGDNGDWKSPQWLIPNNENFAANKVSNYSTQFDGIDDYVDCGTLPHFTTSQTTFSVSFWFKNSSVFGNVVNIGGKIYFVMGSNRIECWNLGNVTGRADTTGVVWGTTWHNLTYVFDGSGATNEDRVKVYVDGVLNSVIYQTTQPTSTAATSVSTLIGSSIFGADYNGNVDEVSIFDSAISIGDVWDGSGEPIDVSGVSGITNYWKMGENATFLTNWTVPDIVGLSNGTSQNMDINNRVGESPGSVNNALSFNMDLIDRVEDTPATP